MEKGRGRFPVRAPSFIGKSYMFSFRIAPRPFRDEIGGKRLYFSFTVLQNGLDYFSVV